MVIQQQQGGQQLAPAAPQQQGKEEQEEIIARWSVEWFQYSLLRGGILRSLADGVEESVTANAKFFLFVYVILAGAQVAVYAYAHIDFPPPISVLMMLFSICGMEGALPGLVAKQEKLRSQGDHVTAAQIDQQILHARIITVGSMIEPFISKLQYTSPIALAGFNVTPILQAIIGGLPLALIVYRTWICTRFIKEMAQAKQRHPKPRVLDKKEYAALKQQARQEAISHNHTPAIPPQPVAPIAPEPATPATPATPAQPQPVASIAPQPATTPAIPVVAQPATPAPLPVATPATKKVAQPATKKVARPVTRKAKSPASVEERLEASYTAMIAAGSAMSGRALASHSGVDRNRATEWLKARQTATPDVAQSEQEPATQDDHHVLQFPGTPATPVVAENEGEEELAANA